MENAGGARDLVRRLLPEHGGSAGLDRLAELAARLLDVPMAQVALMTDVHTVVAGHGLPDGAISSETPLEDAICVVTAGLAVTLPIEDTQLDVRVSEMSAVRSGLVRAYLGVPLHGADGSMLGTLCVFDGVPRSWSSSDVALMEQLAMTARVELELAALTRDYDADRIRWEFAVEVSQLGYFDWNLVTQELIWDDRLIRLYGYDSGDVAFDRSIDSVFARLHPEDAARVSETMSAAIEAVGPIEVVYRIVLPSGATRWLEARGRALRGPDGVANHLMGFSWDVTDREMQEFRADRVLASMPLGHIAMDREWTITHVNAESARLARSAPQDMVGHNFWQLHPVLIGTEFETVYRRVAASHEPETLEAFYPAPLSIWFDVRVTADQTGVSLYFLDVTARRMAQISLDERAEHDRTVAHALQQALLTALPTVPGVQLAARYLTVEGTEQVGGDWYDAILQPGGTLAVSIGDVCGHGIAAAAAMGQLRSMLRAFIWGHDGTVAQSLTRLDTVAQGLGGLPLATLISGRVAGLATPNGPTFVWSNAGHPPPLLLLADGTVTRVEAQPDLLLGVAPGVSRSDHVVDLPPGSTLVLYTDGLVETRPYSVDLGIDRLARTMARHHACDLDELLDRTLHDLRSGDQSDDIAVLAIRIDAASSGGEQPFGPNQESRTLQLAADQTSPGLARTFVREQAAGLPAALIGRAVLLTSEVVTNAVRHGEPEISLQVTRGPSGLRVSVHDRSSARPALPDHTDVAATGGRGVPIIEGLASSWGVSSHPSIPGKAVWFYLHDAPPD